MDNGLIKMESDSNYGGSSSGRIQNLVEDLGDESFETRNEALMTLKECYHTAKFLYLTIL